jgi:hypothetical protein
MSLASKAGLSSGFYMQIHASSAFNVCLSVCLSIYLSLYSPFLGLWPLFSVS